MASWLVRKAQSQAVTKLRPVRLGLCLISRLSPKKLQYRNIKERCYMGHEFTFQVIVKWLVSHLSESAKLCLNGLVGSLDRGPDYYAAMNQRQTDAFLLDSFFPRKRAPVWVPKRF